MAGDVLPTGVEETLGTFKQQLNQAYDPTSFDANVRSLTTYVISVWLTQQASKSDLQLLVDDVLVNAAGGIAEHTFSKMYAPTAKLANRARSEAWGIDWFVDSVASTITETQPVTPQDILVLRDALLGRWGPDIGEVFQSAGLLNLGPDYVRNQSTFNSAIPRLIDPLIVDLDGDGVEGDLPSAPTVYFDLNQDGLAEAVSWTNGEDGIIAHDVNGNGLIDDGGELFGTGPIDGFAALAMLDDNADGRVDAGDLAFSQLLVWKDENTDGISEAGELFGMSALGIAQIDVAHYALIEGGSGQLTHVGQAQLQSGSALQVGNAAFSTDVRNTQYIQEFQLDLRTVFLPTLRGYGALPSLHIAMSLDNGVGSESLITRVDALVGHSLRDLLVHWDDVKSEFQEVLFRWARVDSLVSTSRGLFVDAREVAFLEAYMGEAFVAANFTGTGELTHPGTRQGTNLHDLFEETTDRMLGAFLTQTIFLVIFDDPAIYDLKSDSALVEGGTGPSIIGNMRLSHEGIGQLSQIALALEGTAARQAFWLGLTHMIHDMQVSSGAITGNGGLALWPEDELALSVAITASDPALVWYQEDNDPVHGVFSIEHRFYSPEGEKIGGTDQGDTLTGTAFDDVIFGAAGGDHIDGGDGDDQLYGHDSAGSSDDSGTDWIDGGFGKDYIDAGAGNDTVFVFDGDIAFGGDGNDWIAVDSTSQHYVQNYVDGGLGDDTYVVHPGSIQAYISDGGGTDVLETDLSIVLNVMRHGNATIALDLTNAAHTAYSTIYLVDQLMPNHGIEKLIFANGSEVSLDALVSSWGADIQTRGTAGDDVIRGITERLNSNDIIYAFDGNDSLWGEDGNDALLGGEGNDSLHGGAGNDYLEGGAGNDSLYGDDGEDTVYAKTGDDIVYAGSGNDVVTGEGRLLVYCGDGDDRVIGYSTLVFFGQAGNDFVLGSALDDFYDGGLGADTMAGASGDDTYVVDNTRDVVTELNSEGEDTVQSSINYVLGANAENLMLTGALDRNGNGNALNNVLTGNDGKNNLKGLGGNDYIDGGLGVDSMFGGANDDTYIVDNIADLVGENVNEGTDIVLSSVKFTLGANIEKLTLTGILDIDGTGNSLANTLLGNDGNNRLDCKGGADTMTGGLGNDVYVVDSAADVVVEAIDQGIDTVETTLSYVLGANVENLTLTGTLDRNGNGNGLDNVMKGNAGVNILRGLVGNDFIDGGAAADRMYGAIGNDTFVVDNTGDVLIENLGEGTDTIQTALNYVLGANIENLTLTGTLNRNGNGNALNNVLTGNSGNNVLKGLDGIDTLDGAAGADTLWGGIGGDTFVFSLGSGVDAIKDFSAGQGDLINVDAYTHGVAFAGGVTITADGLGNTIINLGGGNIVTVAGASVLDVTNHMVW